MKKIIPAIILACFIILPAVAQEVKKYTTVPGGYLMVLQQHDSVFQQIEQLAINEKIPSAFFTGLGFAGSIEFGYFNRRTKKYDPKIFNDVELTSFTGSIAWEADKVSIHGHGTAGDKQFNAFAGHILSAVVGNGSIEIMIWVNDKKLQRKMDPAIGANVLQLNE